MELKQSLKASGAQAALCSGVPRLSSAEAVVAQSNNASTSIRRPVFHLIYRAQNYEGHSKDYEFSRLSMQDHWRAGYHDAVRTLRHPEILARPMQAVCVNCARTDLGGLRLESACNLAA
jgi:NTE family protein